MNCDLVVCYNATTNLACYHGYGVITTLFINILVDKLVIMHGYSRYTYIYVGIEFRGSAYLLYYGAYPLILD